MTRTTEELLRDVEAMQRKLRLASLEGAYQLLRKLAEKDWEYHQRKEILNMADSARWAIDELIVL
jgi:hypothetical protein